MDKILIYVLLLNDDCYYIGKTTKNVEERFNEHIKGSAAWTMLHRPIKIIETLNTTNPMEEDIVTKKYMLKYGIENVRGGSYTKITLDDWMIQALKHEFSSIDNCCSLSSNCFVNSSRFTFNCGILLYLSFVK